MPTELADAPERPVEALESDGFQQSIARQQALVSETSTEPVLRQAPPVREVQEPRSLATGIQHQPERNDPSMVSPVQHQQNTTQIPVSGAVTGNLPDARPTKSADRFRPDADPENRVSTIEPGRLNSSEVQPGPLLQHQAANRPEFQPVRSLADWASQVKLPPPAATQPAADNDSSPRASAPQTTQPFESQAAKNIPFQALQPPGANKNAPSDAADLAPSRPAKETAEPAKHPPDSPWWSPAPDKLSSTPALPGWTTWETADLPPEAGMQQAAAIEKPDFSQPELLPMSTAFYPEVEKSGMEPLQLPDFLPFAPGLRPPMNTEEILDSLTRTLAEEYRRYYGHL